MKEFGERLRARARELGLSNAEVARRAGLGERRYGFYVTGAREPNLRTLATICRVLNVEADDLLGLSATEPGDEAGAGGPRRRLIARLVTAARDLDTEDLRLAVDQMDCIVANRNRQ